MRILHVVRGLANSSGTTHIVGPLSEAQAQLGHAVTVMHVGKGGETAIEPNAMLVQSKCFAETLPLGHLGLSRSFAAAIGRAVNEHDVVHIHAVWNFPTWVSMRAAAAFGTPYMVAPQGSFEPWAYSYGSRARKVWARVLELPLLRTATRLQALTNAEEEQIRAFGIKVPVAVIPNGIPEAWTHTTRGALPAWVGVPTGQKTLLYLSRIHPKKGLDVLLRGFADAALPDTVLIVAGGDAGSGYAAEMQQLAQRLGLGERCRFVGEVPGDRKRELLLGVDAFALISHSEGLPVAVLEAMACALPVLLTPGCNLWDVAESGTGVQVRPQPAEVASALRMLFATGGDLREMGRRGRALVKERYTWERIAQQTVQVYQEMLNEHRAQPSTNLAAARAL